MISGLHSHMYTVKHIHMHVSVCVYVYTHAHTYTNVHTYNHHLPRERLPSTATFVVQIGLAFLGT